MPENETDNHSCGGTEKTPFKQLLHNLWQNVRIFLDGASGRLCNISRSDHENHNISIVDTVGFFQNESQIFVTSMHI